MPERTYEIDKENLKFEEVITGALIGVSTVIVVQLLQLTAFDVPLKISLYCFAISIPMLTAYLVSVLIKINHTLQVKMWSEGVAVSIGGACSIVGMGAIFWHFSISIGITFIVAVLAAFVLVRIWGAKMDRVNKKST